MHAIDYVKTGAPKRARFRDSLMTFDAPVRMHDAAGNHMGVALGGKLKTHDGKFVDSTGAFLVGELERLDMTLHEPLSSVTYLRDIDLREDVTIGDEVSSFTVSDYGKMGGLGTGQGIGNGKSWLSQNATQVTGTSVDIKKVVQPLWDWGQEIGYTQFSLAQAARTGRPLDTQMYDALQLSFQMDTDEMVYIGDTANGATGLLNNASVTPIPFLPGAVSGTVSWSTKTPNEILADFNFAISTVWKTAAYSGVPTDVRIEPTTYGYLANTLISNAGNQSILGFLLENNLIKAQGLGNIRILPLKWCAGTGLGGTIGNAGTVNRMLVYTRDKKKVRYPMTMVQRTPVQYMSVWLKSTYFAKLGQVEIPYPETCGYFDGL